MAGRALFVYGTLMSGARVQELTGRHFPQRPATLSDFVRIVPPGGYPYIVPQPGGRVEGFLIDDVDPSSLRALDAYEDEGRLYHRRRVEVTVEGMRVACDTYVGGDRRP
jgi:gamma-glutamylcyclotransferase (GGCT)/AIG2-like uncharacterized protein YtfP